MSCPRIAKEPSKECEHDMSSLAVGFSTRMHRRADQMLLYQLLTVGTPLASGTVLLHMGQQVRQHLWAHVLSNKLRATVVLRLVLAGLEPHLVF